MFLSSLENDSGSREIRRSDDFGIRISIIHSVKRLRSADFDLTCSVASPSCSLVSWS